MIEIIPTVVPASFDDVRATAERYPFARSIHVDFADGIFAPNTTWLPQQTSRGVASRDNSMPWEAHLMVADPLALGERCIAAGATRVIGHIEATADKSADILHSWKAAGANEVGLALLAQTSIEAIDPFASVCDFTMLMTIASIGVQGLPFDEHGPDRVRAMHARFPILTIEVDGGVNETTILPLASAGASRFCAGSVLSKSPEPHSTYRRLLALAESGVE